MSSQSIDVYLQTAQVPWILRSLVTHLCVEKPDRPVKFMIEHLQRHYLPAETERFHTENYYGYKSHTPITYGIHGALEVEAAKKRNRNGMEVCGEEEVVEQAPVEDGKRQRRGAISDVPSAFKSLDLSLFPPKDPEVVEMLERAVVVNPLLKGLERDERESLYRAMFEVAYRKEDTIIREGDRGDNFYIISRGECEVYVKSAGPDPVLTYKAGDSFGELALIHGTPRQATVVAKTDVTVWGLERTAYRATLMKITCDKREKYGEFLHKVPLLSSLDRYERMLICDTLEPIEYPDGAVILRQGEVGHSFFLIVSGQVRAIQRHGDKEGVVGLLGPGDYFGEIALLTDSPRQATCVAVGNVKCAYMQREDFVRVMGPLKNYVNEKIPLYKKFLGEEEMATEAGRSRGAAME